MIKPFSDIRLAVQNALKRHEVINPIEDSCYTIEERKNVKEGKLKRITIEGIPYSANSSITNIWALDFELDEKNILFFTPSCHKMERALIIICPKAIYVLLIEMKSSLWGKGDDGIGVNGIEAKIKESLSKLSILATHFIFNESHDYAKKINLHAIIAFNDELISKQASEDPQIKSYNLYKSFVNSKSGNVNMINIRDYIDQPFNIRMHYVQNDTKNPEEFSFNLEHLIEDYAFHEAVSYDFVCPQQ